MVVQNAQEYISFLYQFFCIFFLKPNTLLKVLNRLFLSFCAVAYTAISPSYSAGNII